MATPRKKPEDKLKAGRKPLYSDPEVMREKIERYFNSIQTVKPIWVTKENSGQFTEEQLEEMTEQERISKIIARDRNGDKLYMTVYIVPPSESALMDYLGIKSRRTWGEYEDNPEFVNTVMEAKKRIEQYRFEDLCTRQGNTSGLQFVFRTVYGYKDTQYAEIKTGKKLEDYIE